MAVSGCSANLEDCFLSAGPTRTKKIHLGLSPSRILVFDNINVTWHRSLENYLIVTAGRNLLSKVEINQSEKDLELHNNATCNWVRDYSKKIEIELFSPNPDYIQLNGFGNFFCADTLNGKAILVRQYGSGESNFLFNVESLEIGFDSYGTLKASGFAQSGFYFTLKSGKLETQNLKIQRLLLITKGDRDLYVWAEDSLYGEIRNNKLVYYKGNPRINVSSPNKNQVLPDRK
jgi:hypothetical protein